MKLSMLLFHTILERFVFINDVFCLWFVPPPLGDMEWFETVIRSGNIKIFEMHVLAS